MADLLLNDVKNNAVNLDGTNDDRNYSLGDVTLVADACVIYLQVPDATIVPGNVTLEPGVDNDASLPALVDDFNRADEGPQPTNWNDTYPVIGWPAQHKILSNQLINAKTGGNNYAGSYYTAQQFGADVFVAAQIVGDANGTFGVHARIQNPNTFTPNLYQFAVVPVISTLDAGLALSVNGAFSGLVSTNIPRQLATGDWIAIQCKGSTITGLIRYDGTSDWIKVLETTDTQVSGPGYAGVLSGDASFEGLDNFSAQTLVLDTTITLTAPTAAVATAVTLAASSNTITLSAPSAAVNLTFPVSTNVITLSAPAQSQLAEITLAASANVITLSAPAQSQLAAVTLAAGASTITLSAPAQSQLAETTLAAGSNTITVSAPAAAVVVGAVTLAAGTNTITVSAPAQSQLVEITLSAGTNTITLSAPSVPAVNLTFPVTTNLITLSAPAQSQLAEAFLAAGSNTITLSAPAATLVVGSVTLAAGSNVITLSAPAQSQSVAVTLAASTNTITLSAPSAIIVPAKTLVASANVITLTAPDADIISAGSGALLAGINVITITAPAPTVHLEIPAQSNTLTLSAPTATAIPSISLAAGSNTISLSAGTATVSTSVTVHASAAVITLFAPQAVMDLEIPVLSNVITITAPAADLFATVDYVLLVSPNTLVLSAPIVTLKQQLFGRLVQTHDARVAFETSHQAPVPVLTKDPDVRIAFTTEEHAVVAPTTQHDALTAWKQDEILVADPR